MTDAQSPTYVLYPTFSLHRWMRGGADGLKPDWAGQELEVLFGAWEDRVTVRGSYLTGGFNAGEDLMMWWIANSADDLQQLLKEFRMTTAGRALHLRHSFMGVHRPPETAPDHIPSFMRGVPPGRYACVYPFVRTPEWYLLPKEERGALLREHGEIGREYPGVLPNTTSAFGLGDYEWILAFEADDLLELVDCIRRLRDSRSRLYVKEETPFMTGIRHDTPGDAVRALLS